MKMHRRWRRALRAIERDLADSDPGLEEFFFQFALLARGQKVPRVEKVRVWPARWIASDGRRVPSDRASEDWRGWLWTFLYSAITLAAMSFAMCLTGPGRGLLRSVVR
jgi:hypothetical protein